MQTTHVRGQLVRRLIVALVIFGTVALLAPMAAQGKEDDDGLSIRFEAPVTFENPTPECPALIVDFGISALDKTGSATNCVQAVIPVACPPWVVALFCHEVSSLLTLRLPGGEIEAEVTLFEIWRCGDPVCNTFAIDQQWPGSVVSASGRFHKLEGASVSGGGAFVLDPAFGVLSLDEVIEIGDED